MIVRLEKAHFSQKKEEKASLKKHIMFVSNNIEMLLINITKLFREQNENMHVARKKGSKPRAAKQSYNKTEDQHAAT